MANQSGDVWRINLEWELNREKGMIVLHREVSTVSDTSEDALGDALVAELVTLGDSVTAAILGNGAKLVCATAQRINAINPTRIYSAFSTAAASAGATALPAMASVLISAYPAAGAAIKSGRSYIPFLDEAKQKEGQILTTTKVPIENVLQPIVEDLMSLAGVADLKAVLWRKVGEITADVISSVLRPVLANQRRRVVQHQTFET